MKKCLLLFILFTTHLIMGQENLIENPGFESGALSWTINQVDHATGWSNGCRKQFLGSEGTSPDLYDRNGYRSCFVEKGLLPRINGETNNRYVHMFNGGETDPTTGESVKATIIETLSEAYSYQVSCYVSREISDPAEDPSLQLEFVLRNNDNCDVEKIVHTSTYITPVFKYNTCSKPPAQPSTDWRQKLGYFNLDAGDISENYNRLEIRIKGHGNILSPVFIDDVELKKVPKVAACFEIKNIYKEQIEQSDYGPQIVKQLCLPKIEIDGSCSANEDGYYIRVSEFSLSPWAIVTDYYNGWVDTGEAPSNINLTNLIGVPSANNDWTSRTFDPTKLYAVSLSVGPIWDAAPFQFFRVQNCQGNKACFKIKNVDSDYMVSSDYGPKLVNELCLPKIEIDGSCSTNEEGYHIRISEFNLSPWAIVTDYYDGWVDTGEVPSNINLTNLIGIPSANNDWMSKTFDPTKLYAVSLSVGPIWDSAPFQFFKVKDCRKIEACFEIKNIHSEVTEPSDYGLKIVNELCLPKTEIDGSCSTNEEGYHIRISEFSLSPWAIITDYYNGWVAPGTAPSNINLTSLIGIPSANNDWTSRTFDPVKLYAVSLSVVPVWDSASFQFFRVIDCRRTINNNIANTESSLVNIYPNPAKEHVNVSFNKKGTGKIEIYRFDGKRIHTDNFINTSSVTLNMSTYNKGLYLIKIYIAQKTETYKIYKE
ncbi:T9SS type A sorting domain-containing protein [Pontimicrobium sp. MEBiC01747]